MAELHEAIWLDLHSLDTVEEFSARAKDFWTAHGVEGLGAIADLAASLANQAAASGTPGSNVAPAPPPQRVLTQLGDSAHHLEVAAACWNFITGRITAGQMAVEDPTLAQEGGELARYGADAIYWNYYWCIWALRDMGNRLSETDFDTRVDRALSDLNLDF